uniref:SUN domain containing ossification factor n=2 Tax=Sus scrofa TaxID=9823 RepID=A0A8D1XFN9_PIG
MKKRELKVSVPRFDKTPWFSKASLTNKPLILSLPKRYPQSSATFLGSSKKDKNLPILFQVPDIVSKVGGNQSDPMLIRKKQMCSTCREMKVVQPRTMVIPDDLKLSFANIVSHRMMSLHPPKAQTVPRPSCGDIPTENIQYRLPILGPRTAVFHGLLSDAYQSLQETQLSPLPRKEPVGKTVRQ